MECINGKVLVRICEGLYANPEHVAYVRKSGSQSNANTQVEMRSGSVFYIETDYETVVKRVNREESV